MRWVWNWIGVMTPDGGGGEGGSKGRGHLFMPEVGDLVLVGFRLGDPNRPYVMGSLYNASTGIGVGEGNRDKSISTRSGIRIAFNDESRSLSITDPSGNMVLMDGKGHVRIDAPRRAGAERRAHRDEHGRRHDAERGERIHGERGRQLDNERGQRDGHDGERLPHDGGERT